MLVAAAILAEFAIKKSSAAGKVIVARLILVRQEMLRKCGEMMHSFVAHSLLAGQLSQGLTQGHSRTVCSLLPFPSMTQTFVSMFIVGVLSGVQFEWSQSFQAFLYSITVDRMEKVWLEKVWHIV